MIVRFPFFIFFSTSLFVSTASAQDVLTLDDLLEQAKRDQSISRQINDSREQRFLDTNQYRQQMLKEAQQRLASAEKNSEQLKRQFDNNENKLAELKKRLDVRSATLGEVFGAVRQVSGDAASMVHNSMISAQLSGREPLMDHLAKSKALPSINELESLWLGLLDEMAQSGKVATYETAIITADGSERTQRVTRVGSFNSFSDGKYLRYLSESQRLVELPRQPVSRFQEMAHELETTNSGLVDIGIDPSRGAILSAIVQTPGMWERIKQGGMIGYIILLLGLIALVLSVERLWVLHVSGRSIRKQLQTDVTDTDNPLGRVLSVRRYREAQDIETLQLKLDEAILKEVPKIERGMSTIAIMAAVAPLLGLLGTVTGMIETFTSITLFGTGDPKYMSSGISQALVTTELGLAVSIPLILLHTFLTSKGNGQIQILDEQSAGLIARSSEQKHGDVITG